MSDKSLWSIGTVKGLDMLCQHRIMTSSVGIWYNDNPLNFSLPLSLLVIIITFVSTRITYFSLRPLRQSLFMAQILAGVVLGHTLFSDPLENVITGAIFPPQVKYIVRTLGDFGMTLHMFMLGLQINLQMLMNTDTKAVSIGICSFLVPFLFGFPVANLSNPPKDGNDFQGFAPVVLMVNSITSFIVVTNLLNHLKILNSELGRLASSASLVSESFASVVRFFFYNLATSKRYSALKIFTVLCTNILYYSVVLLLVRPLLIRITRHSPDGKTLNENQLLITMTIVLSVAFMGEVIGQNAGYAAFILGVSLPDGPPLGTQWEKRIDVIISGIFLPLYYVVGAGIRINLGKMLHTLSLKAEIMLLMSYAVKILGTLLASLWFRIPLQDATVISIIMTCKGITEIVAFVKAMDQKVIDRPLYSMLLVNLIVITGLLTFAVSRLYDPSTRYKAFTRRSLAEFQSTSSSDVRVLVCIHQEDNVSPMMNFLEATNPSRTSRLTVLVLQLNELAGRAMAVLTPHKHSDSTLTRSKHLVNAFDQLQRRIGRGNIMVEHFTAIAPFVSMHNDICTLALDKNANIVIVPFHKLWGIHGEAEEYCPQVRAVNQFVLQKSPCSVGILIDRSLLRSSQAKKPVGTIQSSSYNVTMLFLGSDDDIEALALATRMAKHPNVYLTVVHIRSKDNESNACSQDDLIGLSNYTSEMAKRVVYQEETVQDGEETIQKIRRVEETNDLVIVGKNQQVGSAAISGLDCWGECSELGLLGDLLTTSDFSFSVLVVQKQPSVYQK